MDDQFRMSLPDTVIDQALQRAAPGGAIDLSLSNKADISNTLYRRVMTVEQLNACAAYPYMASAGSPDANFGPRPDYWDVEYHYFDATNGVQFITAVISGDRWYRVFNGGVAKDWKQIATSTPPTEHDLPLANGWAHINTDDPLKCGKCGDGRVQIMGIIIAPADVAPGQQIATLPVGCYPISHNVWLHAVDAATGLDYSLIATPWGGITLWVKAPPGNATLVFPVQSFYGA